jgi:hypothetical protein
MPQDQLFVYLKDTSLTNVAIGLVTTVAGLAIRESISWVRSRKVKAEHEQIDAVRTQLLTDGGSPKAAAAAQIIISTATGQAPSSSNDVDVLRSQITALQHDLREHRTATAEDEKEHAALAATVIAGFANLDRRIDDLEKAQLSKFDVVTTTLTLLGSIATIVGIIFATLRWLHP